MVVFIVGLLYYIVLYWIYTLFYPSPLYIVYIHTQRGGFLTQPLCVLVKLTMSQVWLEAITWTQSSLLTRTERWGFTLILCYEEHLGPSDHFPPALTCCHSENKRRIHGNSQTIGSKTPLPLKRERPERTGEAPTTPVKTHLGAQQIPLETLRSQHCKLFCFYTLWLDWTNRILFI